MEQDNMLNTNTTEIGDWPLWRVLLGKMRENENYGYGAVWETSFFEAGLGAKRGTPDFAFQMLDMRAEMEEVDGYYLRCQTRHDEAGRTIEEWLIPSAAEHEEVARGFEARMGRYAHRSVDIRAKTLANPTATLSSEERANTEARMRIAATRIVLLRREKSVAEYVVKHAPKLLK
jgi:hypothetical protein